MGYFTKDAVSEGRGALAPLSKARVKAAIEAEGWSYSVNSDGDIGGEWEFADYYFFVIGKSEELLHARGVWLATLTDADWARVLEACNTWHDEKLWPKAYVHRNDDGRVRVLTEHNVDYEHGLTDEQLRRHLLCFVKTSESFFERLNGLFPEAWETARSKS